MGNDFTVPGKIKAEKASKMKEEYDYVDDQGKGWRLKDNETMEQLKIRAKGGSKDGK